MKKDKSNQQGESPAQHVRAMKTIELQEIIIRSKDFANRVNAINIKRRGEYNKDHNYFDSCSYSPANYYKDSCTGKHIATEMYVIGGRHGQIFERYDHEPSDKEINNALVYGFNLNSAFLIK